MGASDSKTITEHYSEYQLMQPQYSHYENEFEKSVFMVINLVRADPKKFGVEAVNSAKDSKLVPQAKNLSKDKLISHLKKCSALPQLVYDETALKAVRENNAARIALAEAKPERGGIIEKYD